jgi:hypothetical protein
MTRSATQAVTRSRGGRPACDQPQPTMTEPDATAYNEFVGSVTLAAVNLVAIGGERRTAGEASQTRFDSGAGYQLEDREIHYRFDVIGHLTDDAGTDYGQVSASVIVTLTTPIVPDTACLERFGGTSVALMAHPYLREALASTAQRLGFAGVLLPIITQQPGQRAAASAAAAETHGDGASKAQLA